MTCEICGEKAVYKYSVKSSVMICARSARFLQVVPDMDIQGLGACRKHKIDMFTAYSILVKEGKEAYGEFIKQYKGK